MRILITGGLGFIGSHLICALVEQNHNICVVDDLSNTDLTVLEKVCEITGKPQSVQYHHMSLLNNKSLGQLFKESEVFDACIHLAGKLYSNKTMDNPVRTYQVNIQGTLNLLDCINRYGCKQLIYASSSQVYTNHTTNIEENAIKGGGLQNPTTRSVFFTEEIIKDFSTANPDVHTTIFRFDNVIGRHLSQTLELSPTPSIQTRILSVVREKDGYVKIHGGDYPTKDGTPIRDYVHVLDLVEAYKLVLEKSTPGYVDYNIGFGKGISDLEIVQLAEEVFGVDVPYKLKKRKNGVSAHFYLNTSKADYCLGWRASRGFEEVFLLEKNGRL
jgi:UDP-glucose 4-epimerase